MYVLDERSSDLDLLKLREKGEQPKPALLNDLCLVMMAADLPSSVVIS